MNLIVQRNGTAVCAAAVAAAESALPGNSRRGVLVL